MCSRIKMAGMSDRGRVRPSNQDQYLIADLSRSMLVRETSLPEDNTTRLYSGTTGMLAIVADGMGGQAGGETASALALEELESSILNTLPWCFRLHKNHDQDFQDELKDAVERCQRRIEDTAAKKPHLQGMGTTLTMAYVVWPSLHVLHVGDSRCYISRRGRLKQLTTDHTVAQKLVEEGALDPREAQTSRYSHVLWNAVGGGSPDLRPEVLRVTLRLGDTLLLCSDGLTIHVSDERIQETLRKGLPARESSRELVKLANDAGGEDNITVVVARIDEDAETPAPVVDDSVDTQTIRLDWTPLEA